MRHTERSTNVLSRSQRAKRCNLIGIFDLVQIIKHCLAACYFAYSHFSPSKVENSNVSLLTSIILHYIMYLCMHLCKSANFYCKMHITELEKLVKIHIHESKKQRKKIGTEKNQQKKQER